MYNYDDEVLEVFLENQKQLFPENVAETLEEAEEFLDDCMAVVCKNLREVKEYFEEAGTDIAGMSDDDILAASEVFALPSGRFLIVEG
ncbi:MAG: glyoxalase [Agathobacter sp.]|nr:glyoxalase [Agathobacter sp.]